MTTFEFVNEELVAEKQPLTFEKLLTRITETLVVLTLLGMVVAIWGSVFTRYITNDPIAWGEQVAKYLMVWAVMLGAGLGLREGAHISIGIVVKRLPEAAQRVCSLLVYLILATFLMVGLIYGAIFAYNVREHVDPIINNMSLFYAYSAIPVGCGLMLVQLCFNFRHGKPAVSEGVSLS